MWMGEVIWRERREEVVGGGRRVEERDFLRAEERERKVSLVAWGSRWEWWERKESRPRIGVEVVVVMVVVRRRKRMVVVATETVDVPVVGILRVELESLRS
ncbi:hypothetical protein Hanom_Chr14g01307981 [Helianthus anomalus]